MAKTNPYIKNRKICTFDQFIKKGEKSQKTSGTNEKGEADLTKKHYSGEKKGEKGISTLAEGEVSENETKTAELKEIDEDAYDKMHGVLPPIYFSMTLDLEGNSTKVNGFAVSEPSAEKNGIPTFGGYFKANGKYYECEVTLKNKEGKAITFYTYNNYEFTKGNTAELA